MKKVLMVVPTFNPSNKQENYEVWKRVIDGFVMQRSKDLHIDIGIADNVSDQEGRDLLLKWQKEIPDLYLDFIDVRYSMHICINHLNLYLKDNDYDWIGHSNSDVIWENPDSMSTLLKDAELNKDCVVISPQVDIDMNACFPQFIEYDDRPPTMLKVPEGINGHAYLHKREFYQAYDYKRPDVLWAHRAESFIGYCCAAIRKREYISHRVMLHHYRNGSYNMGMEREDFDFYDKPMEAWGTKEDFMKMVEDGYWIGFGFEECYILADNPIEESRAHNSDVYDEDKYPLTDDLYKFLRKNLFLTKEQLDYDKLNAKIYDPVIKSKF